MKHRTVHGGHKDYKCESCGKSFSEAWILKRHSHTVHEGSNDYKCDSCGKSFTKIDDLKEHKLETHTVPNELIAEEDEVENESKNENNGKFMTIECALCSIVITASSRHFKTKFNR